MSTTAIVSYMNIHDCTVIINNPLTLSVNKRLDEWISEDLLDVERLQLPRKDSKVSTLSKNSRPASPDVATLNAEPKRHNSITGRKKIKLDSAEVSMSWAKKSPFFMQCTCTYTSVFYSQKQGFI